MSLSSQPYGTRTESTGQSPRVALRFTQPRRLRPVWPVGYSFFSLREKDDQPHHAGPLCYSRRKSVTTEKNKLYYGDNYEVLQRYVKDESVDLVYLDPPFNSRQDYNVLFAEKDGSQSSSQIHAFEDTWEWNIDAEAGAALSRERLQRLRAFR